MKALLSALLCWGAMASAQAVPVYIQPFNTTGSDAIASELVSGGNTFNAYDDFKLTTATTITGLSWVGSMFGPSEPLQPINGFKLTFLSDNAGAPGASLFSQTIAGTANETFLGNLVGGFPAFSYQATLSTPFAVAAGTTYWLSIQAQVGKELPFWGWAFGTGGNEKFRLNNTDSPGLASFPADLAFTLDHQVTAVPEPSTLMLSLVGLAALLVVRRRQMPRA